MPVSASYMSSIHDSAPAVKGLAATQHHKHRFTAKRRQGKP